MSDAFDPYYHWLGIPPHEQPPHHYRLLSLQLYEPNEEVIQHAVDRLMAHIRTFQSGQRAADSQRLLNEIARARICLLTAAKKVEYDRGLREKLAPAPFSPPAPAVTAPPARKPQVAAEPGKPASPEEEVLLEVLPSGDVGKGPWWWVGLIAVVVAAVLLGVLISPFFFPETEEPGGQVAAVDKPTELASSKPVESVAQEPGTAEDEPVGSQPTVSPGPIAPPTSDTGSKASDSTDTGARMEAGSPPILDRSAVSEDIRAEFDAAIGFITDEVAVCQTLPLEAFSPLAETLRAKGYRPTRIRPYVAAQQVQVAACWVRDGRSWKLIWMQPADDFNRAAERLAEEHFQPVDVAGFHNGETFYVGVFGSESTDTPATTMTLGLTLEQTAEQNTRLLAQNHYPSAIHIFRDGQQRQRESRVWTRQSPQTPTKCTRWGNVLKSEQPLFPIATDPMRPLDVTVVQPSSPDSRELMWYAIVARESNPSAALSGLSPEDHRTQSLQLVARGYRPAGVAFAQLGEQTIATSVWHTAEGTSASGREPLLQVAGVLPSTDSRPKPPPVVPPAETAPTAPPPSVAEVVKLALPVGKELEQANDIVEQRYNSLASQAKTPAAKTVLAKQLLADAESEQDPSVRFALLQRACEIAEMNAQVELAFEAIASQGRLFDTDTLQQQADSLKRVLSGAKRNPNRHWLVWMAFQLAEQAQRAERFPLAEELTVTAGNAARRSGDNHAAKAARDLGRRVEYSRQLWQAAAEAEKVLAQTAQDPSANLARGQYLCFVQGDWQRERRIWRQAMKRSWRALPRWIKQIPKRRSSNWHSPTAGSIVPRTPTRCRRSQSGVARFTGTRPPCPS